MGYRDDDIVDSDRADAALRRALEQIQALDQLDPPPDLVSRTARRLPLVTPAMARRQVARQMALGITLRLALAGVAALLMVLSALSFFGGGERLALLFGDGERGLSRALLIVQLLAKPLWHAAAAGGAGLWLAGVVALAGASWLWWRTLRRTPIYAMENAP